MRKVTKALLSIEAEYTLVFTFNVTNVQGWKVESEERYSMVPFFLVEMNFALWEFIILPHLFQGKNIWQV